ncbi:hypothetical protein AALO_G00214900 [Alosa alosa]|uniref:Uncharacterized protein n=1 Tax=Alosa alosa TaxID=278164 RepID=A0AAV6G449_9TELE|nr:hypothetical protein AALO_G00214900 [Alosa alosa]
MLNEDDTIESRREVVIRGLTLYLGEYTGELMKDYQVINDVDAATIQEAITTFALGIFFVSKGRDGLPKQAGIAIEGPFWYPRCGTCLHLSDGPYLCLGTEVP